MVERIEEYIQKLEECSDPATRETARQLVQTILALHGEALAKILEHAAKNGAPGFTESMAQDLAVSQVLLLHGLHPVDVQTRVKAALEKVRPQLQSHGGSVELLSIDSGRVRLQLHGSCHGCPSSAMTIRGVIEEAILETAPDAGVIEVV